MSELAWQKSSFSEGAGDNCLNIAAPQDTSPTLHLRESDDPTTTLTTTPKALAALIRTLTER
ncbi:DUF397 domain-containing protein [Streptomyces sp. NPDC005562]|uniref:DUF397 domain-containing protein n=1 Tax=unclassified Streptomyces TaxID=2593676 RepID=UPI0033A0108B